MAAYSLVLQQRHYLGSGGRQLHYPAGSAPGFTDVTLSLKLAADLAMQRLLVAHCWIINPPRSQLTNQLLLLCGSLRLDIRPAVLGVRR